MIENIDDLNRQFKVVYNDIFQTLNNIRVGQNKFETIISEHLVTFEDFKPLDIVREYNGDSPLRIQLKDISGIGSSSLPYHITNEWAKGTLARWPQVIVLPINEFKAVDISLNIRNICAEYLGEKVAESIIDEAFYKNTLFIIKRCGEFDDISSVSLRALEAKGANILVLSDGIKNFSCLESAGYTGYKTGLKAPTGRLLCDDETDVDISGLEIIGIGNKVRGWGFDTCKVHGSVIDIAARPVLDSRSGETVLRGRERRVPHNIRFIL